MQATCPDKRELGRYVTGELAETEAQVVALHLDSCSGCQEHVDSLARSADTMVQALRRKKAAEVSVDEPELAQLIAQAKQIDPLAAAPPAPLAKRISRAIATEDMDVDIESFVACLRKSGLMRQHEVDQLLAGSNAPDGRSFARQLVRQQKLTPYQARALARGKWRGLVLGNYVVLDKLGQGGMGHVFKARHKRMGRLVCLKVLHQTMTQSPEMVLRFQREARTVAALRHPNIVVAHDADEADGIHFLVMEYVEGRDLSKHVTRQGTLAVNDAARVIQHVAQALDYAHKQGVIHRDVKPHNLLLEQSGAIKILDMGLARFDSYFGQADATTHVSMTNSGAIMGTVDYMSPEQALNSRKVDERSDVYSLGCTLWYLLVGGVMFDGETVMEKLIAHRERPAPKLRSERSDVPKELEAIFQMMVAKSPDDRYETMDALAADLELFLTGAKPNALKKLENIPGRRMRRALVGSAAGLSIVAAVLGLVLWNPLGLGSGADDSDNTADHTDVEPPAPPAPQIVGHPNTLLNGGKGRALIVVPSRYFYEDHYERVTNALKSRGFDIVNASSSMQPAHPKHNKIAPVDIQLSLDDFKAEDFDAVVFIGGSTEEFTHKQPTGNAARRVIESSLNAGLAVAALEMGIQPLNDTGLIEECKFEKSREVLVGSPKDKPGAVLNGGSVDNTERMIDVMAEEVLVKRGKVGG